MGPRQVCDCKQTFEHRSLARGPNRYGAEGSRQPGGRNGAAGAQPCACMRTQPCTLAYVDTPTRMPHTQCCTCTRTCTQHMHATCTPDPAHLHARVHTHTRATNTILHTCLCTHTHTCHTHSQTCTCTCVYTPTHATHTQNCTLTVYTHMHKDAHTCTHKPALTCTCRHEYTGTHANRHGSGARPCARPCAHACTHTHAGMGGDVARRGKPVPAAPWPLRGCCELQS